MRFQLLRHVFDFTAAPGQLEERPRGEFGDGKIDAPAGMDDRSVLFVPPKPHDPDGVPLQRSPLRFLAPMVTDAIHYRHQNLEAHSRSTDLSVPLVQELKTHCVCRYAEPRSSPDDSTGGSFPGDAIAQEIHCQCAFNSCTIGNGRACRNAGRLSLVQRQANCQSVAG
jgi:hypothetical protein